MTFTKYQSFIHSAFIFFFSNLCPVWSDELPRFDWPVACEINKTCFIQNYVDLDPSPNVKDFACQSATYDGHKGTDIRLLSLRDVEKSVPVLAAAPGKIKATRDGVPDQLLRDANPNAITDKECGNGVVIDHGNGWESQYCHLREGSIRVKANEIIDSGKTIGLVGYSGMADFAHLHFEVRHVGKPVDPFINKEQTNFCVAQYEPPKGLWQNSKKDLADSIQGQIIELSFSGAIPDLKRIEYGDAIIPPSRQSPQLLFVARMINLRKGDTPSVELSGPSNFNGASEEKPLEKNKATYVFYAGRKLKEREWPSGTYKGTIRIARNNAIIFEQSSEIYLP